MSWEAVQWANKQRLRLPQEQLVLVLLANAADPEGVAFSWWKSKDHWMEYLADRSRMSRATVFRHLGTIESLGLGKREKVVRADGSSFKIMTLDLTKSVVMTADDDAPSLTHETSLTSETLTGETQPVSPVRLQEVHKEVLKDFERETRARAKLDQLRAMSQTTAIDNPDKVAHAFELLPDAEHDPAMAGYPLWVAELKQLGRKYVPSLETYLDRRNWKNLKPVAKPAKGKAPDVVRPVAPYPENSREGRAIIRLGKIGYVSLLIMGGNVLYSGEITPQLLAFADAPAENIDHEIGSGQFRAYDDLVAKMFAGKARARLTKISVPWDWPPRKDGSIITTGPPGELSDADAQALMT